MTADPVAQVIEEYYTNIRYKSVAHPALVILFSAVPGSGKTTLARRLARDLKACYIQADGLRTMLSGHGIDPRSLRISPLTTEITQRIFENDPNKLIVLDASIDRTWPEVFERLKKDAIPSFLIRLTISPDEVSNRLIKRDGSAKSDEEMQRFRNEFEACKRQVEADMELENVYVYEEVLAQVKQKLWR